MSGISNPFNKQTVSKTTSTGNKPSNTSNQTDNMREGTKKQILKEFDNTTDSIDKTVMSNEELIKIIEEAVFVNSGKNSKAKEYRDLAKKVISRIKGSQKTTERLALRAGLISANEIVVLNDKDLEAKLKSESFNEIKKKTNSNKPPKLPFGMITNIQASIDLSGSTDMTEFIKNSAKDVEGKIESSTQETPSTEVNNNENKQEATNNKDGAEELKSTITTNTIENKENNKENKETSTHKQHQVDTRINNNSENEFIETNKDPSGVKEEEVQNKTENLDNYINNNNNNSTFTKEGFIDDKFKDENNLKVIPEQEENTMEIIKDNRNSVTHNDYSEDPKKGFQQENPLSEEELNSPQKNNKFNPENNQQDKKDNNNNKISSNYQTKDAHQAFLNEIGNSELKTNKVASEGVENSEENNHNVIIRQPKNPHQEKLDKHEKPLEKAVVNNNKEPYFNQDMLFTDPGINAEEDSLHTPEFTKASIEPYHSRNNTDYNDSSKRASSPKNTKFQPFKPQGFIQKGLSNIQDNSNANEKHALNQTVDLGIGGVNQLEESFSSSIQAENLDSNYNITNTNNAKQKPKRSEKLEMLKAQVSMKKIAKRNLLAQRPESSLGSETISNTVVPKLFDNFKSVSKDTSMTGEINKEINLYSGSISNRRAIEQPPQLNTDINNSAAVSTHKIAMCSAPIDGVSSNNLVGNLHGFSKNINTVVTKPNITGINLNFQSSNNNKQQQPQQTDTASSEKKPPIQSLFNNDNNNYNQIPNENNTNIACNLDNISSHNKNTENASLNNHDEQAQQGQIPANQIKFELSNINSQQQNTSDLQSKPLVNYTNLMQNTNDDQTFQTELKVELLSLKETNMKQELQLNTEKILNKLLKEELEKANSIITTHKNENNEVLREKLLLENNKLKFQTKLLENEKTQLSRVVTEQSNLIKEYEEKINLMIIKNRNLETNYESFLKTFELLNSKELSSRGLARVLQVSTLQTQNLLDNANINNNNNHSLIKAKQMNNNKNSNNNNNFQMTSNVDNSDAISKQPKEILLNNNLTDNNRKNNVQSSNHSGADGNNDSSSLYPQSNNKVEVKKTLLASNSESNYHQQQTSQRAFNQDDFFLNNDSKISPEWKSKDPVLNDESKNNNNNNNFNQTTTVNSLNARVKPPIKHQQIKGKSKHVMINENTLEEHENQNQKIMNNNLVQTQNNTSNSQPSNNNSKSTKLEENQKLTDSGLNTGGNKSTLNPFTNNQSFGNETFGFTNGNPNIIEEVGSDNYLNMNGNTYDEIRDSEHLSNQIGIGGNNINNNMMITVNSNSNDSIIGANSIPSKNERSNAFEGKVISKHKPTDNEVLSNEKDTSRLTDNHDNHDNQEYSENTLHTQESAEENYNNSKNELINHNTKNSQKIVNHQFLNAESGATTNNFFSTNADQGGFGNRLVKGKAISHMQNNSMQVIDKSKVTKIDNNNNPFKQDQSTNHITGKISTNIFDDITQFPSKNNNEDSIMNSKKQKSDLAIDSRSSSNQQGNTIKDNQKRTAQVKTTTGTGNVPSNLEDDNWGNDNETKNMNMFSNMNLPGNNNNNKISNTMKTQINKGSSGSNTSNNLKFNNQTNKKGNLPSDLNIDI